LFFISHGLRSMRFQMMIPCLFVIATSLLPVEPAFGDALGDCNEGRTPSARIAGCSLIIEAAPSSEVLAIAFMNRGIARATSGGLNDALSDFDAALDASPGMTVVHYNRGNLHLDLGNHVAASRDFSAVIEVEPGFALAWLNRGFAREKIGEFSGARSDYQRALLLDGKLDAARRALARLKKKELPHR